ncbi:MAG: ribbon-helix-helix domain-containing protein [Hyphomonadaceae bacterium]|nr:ribbon-helix-helix domain-containing protein [Hyphomonadaceae bacterium]
MRTLVDIPEADLSRLETLAKLTKVSRARLIREAIGDYLAQKTDDPIDAAFGLWKGRYEDGLSYQNKLREEW